MAREQTVDQQRAALADKLAALIPPDVADLVRIADGAVAKINAEAADLQNERREGLRNPTRQQMLIRPGGTSWTERFGS
jgi:hypothetical protein